jgi:putative membrane protein
MSLPSKPTREQQQQYDRLSKLSGEHFNAEYINTMVQDHSKDVSEYQQEMNSAQDPAVKNYASVNLPILHNHLVRAQNIPGKNIVNQGSSSQSDNTKPPKQ